MKGFPRLWLSGSHGESNQLFSSLFELDQGIYKLDRRSSWEALPVSSGCAGNLIPAVLIEGGTIPRVWWEVPRWREVRVLVVEEERGMLKMEAVCLYN